MDLSIKGFHHITAITSHAGETIRFYTRVLGMRLVKKTVNFDDPTAYHLYFGDDRGTPGTILTFFDWGPSVNQGTLGAGMTHHIAFATRNDEGLLQWKTRLEQNAVPVQGPFDRQSYKSIYLLDPDGLIIEIATPRNKNRPVSDRPSELSIFSKANPPLGLAKGTSDDSAEMKLVGLHHATALANNPSHSKKFYSSALNLNKVTGTEDESDQAERHYAFELGEASFLSFLHSDTASAGNVGIGAVHHIAMAVDDEADQLKWRERLLARGAKVTGVLDRKYFKSIYFREPNGVLLEIATVKPGFMVDEPFDKLGQTLTLPAWLETDRQAIEASLTPIGP